MKQFTILTGASGSGKTTLAQKIERDNSEKIDVFYFDRIGVPSSQEMILQYGSTENWQKETTLSWLKQISGMAHRENVLFEGQMRPSTLQNCLQALGLMQAKVILIDCSEVERRKRLHSDRSQPELASEAMMHFARSMRLEAKSYEWKILDTSTISFNEAQREIETYCGIQS